eukprot:2253813-Rhodomonas_salina.1
MGRDWGSRGGDGRAARQPHTQHQAGGLCRRLRSLCDTEPARRARAGGRGRGREGARKKERERERESERGKRRGARAGGVKVCGP